MPQMTTEQRAEASARAAAARKDRALVRARLKRGEIGLSDVLADAAHNDAVAKLRVVALLESLPGIGRAKAQSILERNGIADSRRVRGLGVNQRNALVSELE